MTITATDSRRIRGAARLAEPVQRFIVQRLAMYDVPSDVARAVNEEFGVEVTRQQVEKYSALRAGDKPAARWVALFEATREAFREKLAEIPTAYRAVRLHRLDRMAGIAERRGNYVLAAQLLEQIAKEVGDLYTNKRKLVGGSREEGDAPVAVAFFMPDVPPPIGVQPRLDDDEDDAAPRRAIARGE